MSLLTILEDAADRIGLPRPTAVIGSSDHQTRQLLSLANQVGKELQRRHDWQRLTVERTITATATETQSSALPTAFDRMVPKTFWNRTANRRVAGPVSAQRWQAVKSGLVIQPWDSFRIRGNDLLMTPTPTAGDTLAFEYVSKYWCMSDGDTSPDQAEWAADNDTSIWDDEVHTLGIVWRYLKARGLEYAEVFRDYEVEVARLISNDGVISDIDMGGGEEAHITLEPYITDGSWSLT